MTRRSFIALATAAPLAPRVASAFPSSVVIGFIGDSITWGQGASNRPTTAAPPLEISLLNNFGATFTFVNQGVTGSATDDWVSGSANLNAAITAFAGASVISIMLGTNDCAQGTGRPHNPASVVQSNLLSTITALKAAGFNKIILNSSTYSSSPVVDMPLLLTYNGAFANLAAADPRHVFIGDQSAYAAFQANSPAWYSDSPPLHPNDTGYAQLGPFWAKSFLRVFGSIFPMPGAVGASHL